MRRLGRGVSLRRMATSINDPTLGDLEFEDGYAEVVVHVGGRPIDLDVNFEEDLDEQALRKLAPMLSDIGALEQRAREALSADLAQDDEDGAARLYRSHHFEVLEPEALERVFGTADIRALSDENYLATFVLTRIGVYPEEADASVLLDLRAGDGEDTNYLLSVVFDASGELADVTMES